MGIQNHSITVDDRQFSVQLDTAFDHSLICWIGGSGSPSLSSMHLSLPMGTSCIFGSTLDPCLQALAQRLSTAPSFVILYVGKSLGCSIYFCLASLDSFSSFASLSRQLELLIVENLIKK